MKYFWLFFLIGFVFVSCHKKGCTDPLAVNYDQSATKDDGSCIPDYCTDCGFTCQSGFITADETWTADHVYEVCGRLVIVPGVTLTIEPGTIVKFNEGTGTLASCLIVAQGGTLNAVGTANAPIIFTSVLDNIEPWQFSGTNLTENDKGLWGGLIILGEAPISAADGDVLSQLTGIPVADEFGQFGGDNTADNSGSLQYVSIRHGGAMIGAGYEVSGLVLGGVGSGTTISNVEVVAGLSDGVEFLGGTVDVDNLLVGFVGDDAVDIDMNYAGKVEDFTVKVDSNGDKALEVSGPEGITHTDGMFELKNGSVLSETGSESLSVFNSDAKGTVENVEFNGGIKIAADYDAGCNQLIGNSLFYLLETTPRLMFTSCNRTTLTYSSSCPIPVSDSTAAEALIVPTSTQGNTNTDLNWTWMHANGKL